MTKLVAIGLAAGLLGTIVRQVLRSVDGGFNGPLDLDPIVGIIAVGLLAYVLLRPESGRPGSLELGAIIMVSEVTQYLLPPAFDWSWDTFSPLDPDA